MDFAIFAVFKFRYRGSLGLKCFQPSLTLVNLHFAEPSTLFSSIAHAFNVDFVAIIVILKVEQIFCFLFIEEISEKMDEDLGFTHVDMDGRFKIIRKMETNLGRYTINIIYHLVLLYILIHLQRLHIIVQYFCAPPTSQMLALILQQKSF